jgi:hypothetical protein
MSIGAPERAAPEKETDGRRPLRVAIVSTPRSGNTWLWHLLTTAYDIPGVAVHNPIELDWRGLPPACVLQVHWRLIPSFVARLQEHGFRVVVMGRHPLDVLISILHFALHDFATARWLEGEDGNERGIFGAMPRSDAFRDYATGPRAAALLSVSSEWWHVPGVLQVRYEDLNASPHAELERIIGGLGVPPVKPAAEAVEATTIPKLRVRWQNNHYFWKGKTSLWRSLLTAGDVDAITPTLKRFLTTVGYELNPDPELNPSQADANWLKLVWADLVEDLHNLANTQRALRTSEKTLDEVRARCGELQETVARLEPELAATRRCLADVEDRLNDTWRGCDLAQQELHATRDALQRTQAELRCSKQDLAVLEESRQWALRQLETLQERLVPFSGLSPLGLRVARHISLVSSRFPEVAAMTKESLTQVRRFTGALFRRARSDRAGSPLWRRLRTAFGSFWLT